MLATPLHKLLKKDQAFELTEESRAAWDSLKKALINPLVLARPDTSKPYILSTDAFGLGIGAILSQKDDNGKERPIYFASRSLSPAETRYSATELELLAVV